MGEIRPHSTLTLTKSIWAKERKALFRFVSPFLSSTLKVFEFSFSSCCFPVILSRYPSFLSTQKYAYHRKATKNQTQVFRPLCLFFRVYERGNTGEIHEMAGIIHAWRTYTSPTSPEANRKGWDSQPWLKREVESACLVARSLQSCYFPHRAGAQSHLLLKRTGSSAKGWGKWRRRCLKYHLHLGER